MNELQLIESMAVRTARRRRLLRAWRGVWHGFLMATLLWVVALIAFKIFPLPVVALAVAGIAGVLLLLGGFIAGWRRPETPLGAALWIDQHQRLQERFSTALEVGRDEKMGEWRELVIRDAARHLTGLDIRRLLPFGLPRASRWVLLGLAVGASLGFVPEYRSPAYLQKQREKESIREAGRNLSDLTRRSLERHPPALEATREALKSVGELGDQLSKTPLTKSEALRDLAKMTDKVQQESRELSRNPALRSVERTASASKNSNSGNAPGEIQKQIESLQKSLGDKASKSDALEKLQKDLQKAQQAAAGMLGKNSGAADASRESLAKALSNLSQQAQEIGASLPSLEEAVAALEAGKIDQVLKDLQFAEKDLDKIREMAQALQQLQQQAAQMGRDLAEQLKNGEAEAAVATLQKMVNQLKAGALSQEQLNKMMDEVSKAVDPAAPYGKVAEHLKQAVKQMQQGQKPRAAESLADAARELQDLMQQLADAQDLKSTLDALKRAQMCVGNGMSWGQCQGLPGFKPGGKPGKGVGTWADESGWMDVPPQNELWDNSGIQRPDMDARGQTDRGDAELPEGMSPTKVKGQMNPGGQMPSITLKGVSIKGQSTVAVQAAVTSAQSEAQSALSQDQVPRAYRGAVKEYFDDLKK